MVQTEVSADESAEKSGICLHTEKAIADMMARRAAFVPADPVDMAKMVIALEDAISAGPWHACHEGACSCKQVWTADYPVSEVTHGEWGDEYPALRPIETDGMSGTAVEAYMCRLTYGEIPDSIATANAKFIALARTALPFFAKAFLESQSSGDRSDEPKSSDSE